MNGNFHLNVGFVSQNWEKIKNRKMKTVKSWSISTNNITLLSRTNAKKFMKFKKKDNKFKDNKTFQTQLIQIF